MIRVAVTGAGGKMGQAVVGAVNSAPDLELVAAIDPSYDQVNDFGYASTVHVGADLGRALESSGAQVLVDFTVPSAVVGNIETALAHRVSCVVGTTGIAPAELDRLQALIPSETCLFIAPNFAIGAVLMMRFAEIAARYMADVEIIELHHPGKVDAPSGTAIRTAELVGQARSERSELSAIDPQDNGAPVVADAPARGASYGGIAVHAVRLTGMLAHQEVLFGDSGQSLTIRHDTYDRSAFMPGVTASVRAIGAGGREGLIVGLENLLEL